jgi:NDP-sugar pyrophosphorylase family protein
MMKEKGHNGYPLPIWVLNEIMEKGINRIVIHDLHTDEAFEFYIGDYITEGVEVEYYGEDQHLLDTNKALNKVENCMYYESTENIS